MIWVLFGLGAAVALLMLLKWWAHAPTATARNLALGLIIGLCAVLGLVLFAMGKGLLAVLPGGYALFRMAAPWFARIAGQKAYRSFRNRRTGPGAGQGPGGEQGSAPAASGDMTRSEALEVLGLDAEASADDISAAHRRLIAAAHPDKGGSDWMAAKINQARAVLLDGD